MRIFVYSIFLSVITSTVALAQTGSPGPAIKDVPAISIWGMVALGVMFAIVAVIMIRKRFSSQS